MRQRTENYEPRLAKVESVSLESPLDETASLTDRCIAITQASTMVFCPQCTKLVPEDQLDSHLRALHSPLTNDARRAPLVMSNPLRDR